MRWTLRLCLAVLVLHGGAALADCGDGVLDAGEQCDAGTSNGSAFSCCGAACSYVTAGTVCRTALGSCDVAETCRGDDQACPADALVPGCLQVQKCVFENPATWALRFTLGAGLSVATCLRQCAQGGGNGNICLSATTGTCLCGTSTKPASSAPPTTGCTATCAGSTDECGGPANRYTCYAPAAVPPTSTATAAIETPTDTPTDTPRDTATATPPAPPSATATETAPDTATPTPSVTATLTAGGCPVAPAPGCTSGKGTLRLQSAAGAAKLRWRLRRAAIDRGHLGDPNAGSRYRVCLYADDALLQTFAVEARAGRGLLRNGDLRLVQHDGSPDGIARLYVHAGQRRGRIYVGGRGDHLRLPALPLAYSSSVRVQLHVDDRCWESRLPAPATRNTAGRFFDR